MKAMLLIITTGLMTIAINTHACNVVPKGICYIEETGQIVFANTFFSLVSEKAAQDGVTCTIGRVKGKQSGRMYNTSGVRIEKELGCLSHKEIKEIQLAYGLAGSCKKYTCQEF